VEYVSVGEEPSSRDIWLGLFGCQLAGPAIIGLAGWSPAVATTLKVGGAATTASSLYMTEEYSRATYYAAQAGDTAGVWENATKATSALAGATAGAYGSWKAARATPPKTVTSAPIATTGGRLGKPSTRAQVAEIQTELKTRGWTVQKGGTLGEEYIPGPGGARRGSAYPDITATKNGRTLRINTIDTLSDGLTHTAREATNAAKIRSLRPNDHLLLVPKQR